MGILDVVIKENHLESPVKLHKTTERLGTDPIGKLLIRLSLPSILSMVSFSLYNLINTFWVARLGYQTIAAITVILPFYIFTFAVGMGIAIGTNALASRRFGEKNPESTNIIAGQAIFLVIVFGFFSILITNLFPRQILTLCGATPDILELGEKYLRIMSLGTPFFLLSLSIRNLIHAFGDTLRPMIFNISSNVINAILDPFLIFGLVFFPEMGVSGAAVASVISGLISAGLYLWYILKGKTSYRLRWQYLLPRWAIIKDICRVGLPSFFMDATESVVFALYLHIASGYGSVVLAASGIAMRIADLAFMPILGTAQGLLPIIGFSLGAQHWTRLWEAVRKAALWLGLAMAGATILLLIFTSPIVHMFKPDPELVEIAVPGLRIFCASMCVIGPTIIFITTFQGLSKGKVAWALSLVRQLLFLVPAIYILPAFLGLTGVWLAMPVSDVLAFFTAGSWILREYRQQVKKGHLKKTPLKVTAETNE